MTQKSLGDKFSLGSAARSPKEDVMKRNLIGILSVVVMSLMLNATGAYAQSYVRADVPFAFNVGSKQLPAGTYEIRTFGPGADEIMIRNHETKASALSIARPEDRRITESKLVFDRVGNQYFLTEVWRNTGAAAMVVPTSKHEEELKKELRLAAGQSNSAEEVMVALY
jgi:hypothetical protein